MSFRPPAKVSICGTSEAGLLVQDEICLDVAGVTVEAMRFRLLHPQTLATLAVRITDGLTGADVVGTPVACACDSAGAALTNMLAFVGGTLTSTVNGVAANVGLQGDILQSLGGVQLGYLLPL